MVPGCLATELPSDPLEFCAFFCDSRAHLADVYHRLVPVFVYRFYWVVLFFHFFHGREKDINGQMETVYRRRF
jgi:hypothetical protein